MHNPKTTVRLALVLADGQWHFGSELARRVSWRFGSAIERIRKGDLGRPLAIETEHVNATRWRYRAVGWPGTAIDTLQGDDDAKE